MYRLRQNRCNLKGLDGKKGKIIKEMLVQNTLQRSGMGTKKDGGIGIWP